MQGFRDGASGVFGDRISNSLLHRLDEQYPGQDEFKGSYVEGFKDGVANRSSSVSLSPPPPLPPSLSPIIASLPDPHEPD